MTDAAIRIRDLEVHYPLGRRFLGKPDLLKAVAGITLDIPRGAFFGLVGESGSGKTTLGRATLASAPISAGSVTVTDGQGEGLRRAPISTASRRGAFAAGRS